VAAVTQPGDELVQSWLVAVNEGYECSCSGQALGWRGDIRHRQWPYHLAQQPVRPEAARLSRPFEGLS
jgi:hypothetical protein